ncbi:MAG: helix-turn-helix domain-containing protein [Pannonibacter sp.]
MDAQSASEQFVPMILFASNLRRRAEELGISNAEVARRVGLSERRYAHYVSGKREPDLATLVRIAEVLGTTPNWLLAVEDGKASPSATSLLKDRLKIAANAMSEQGLEITVVQAEAVAAMAKG